MDEADFKMIAITFDLYAYNIYPNTNLAAILKSTIHTVQSLAWRELTTLQNKMYT